jgi:hypothetical protein
MQCSPIPPPFIVQVPPKHRTSLYRPERQHIPLLTLHEIAPLRILLTPIDCNLWKLRPTKLTIAFQDAKEGSVTLSFVGRFDAPIEVSAIFLRFLILDDLNHFDLLAREEALEFGGAVLQARGYGVIPWNESGGAGASFACNGWAALAVRNEGASEDRLSIFHQINVAIK